MCDFERVKTRFFITLSDWVLYTIFFLYYSLFLFALYIGAKLWPTKTETKLTRQVFWVQIKTQNLLPLAYIFKQRTDLIDLVTISLGNELVSDLKYNVLYSTNYFNSDFFSIINFFGDFFFNYQFFRWFFFQLSIFFGDFFSIINSFGEFSPVKTIFDENGLIILLCSLYINFTVVVLLCFISSGVKWCWRGIKYTLEYEFYLTWIVYIKKNVGSGLQRVNELVAAIFNSDRERIKMNLTNFLKIFINAVLS
jgi:hypothetical protein